MPARPEYRPNLLPSLLSRLGIDHPYQPTWMQDVLAGRTEIPDTGEGGNYATSSVLGATFTGDGGSAVFVPTIRNIGGQHVRMAPPDALHYAQRRGDRLPEFPSEQAAEEFERRQHDQLEQIMMNQAWPHTYAPRLFDHRGGVQ